MAGFAICDDEACREASYQEIIRRYFASACAVKKGVAMPEELRKQEMLMNSLHLDVSMRRTVPAARAKLPKRARLPLQSSCRTGGSSPARPPV